MQYKVRHARDSGVSHLFKARSAPNSGRYHKLRRENRLGEKVLLFRSRRMPYLNQRAILNTVEKEALVDFFAIFSFLPAE